MSGSNSNWRYGATCAEEKQQQRKSRRARPDEADAVAHAAKLKARQEALLRSCGRAPAAQPLSTAADVPDNVLGHALDAAVCAPKR